MHENLEEEEDHNLAAKYVRGVGKEVGLEF
jgi:hypothetical protein